MPFKKGQSGNPLGKPVGIKNKETLLREERRAIFDEQISKRWLEVINQLPPTYIADQFLGKAIEEIKMSGELNTNSCTAEQIALIKSGVKKKLADDK
jgi:Family of unknown function (DUF5681)